MGQKVSILGGAAILTGFRSGSQVENHFRSPVPRDRCTVKARWFRVRESSEVFIAGAAITALWTEYLTSNVFDIIVC